MFNKYTYKYVHIHNIYWAETCSSLVRAYCYTTIYLCLVVLFIKLFNRRGRFLF